MNGGIVLRPQFFLRHINSKCARGLNQLTRIGFFINHHANFRWVKIERHIPRRRHDVALTVVHKGNQDGRPVIEEAIGLIKFDQNNNYLPNQTFTICEITVLASLTEESSV